MAKTLKKYFFLYLAIFRASFIADLEYRANFATRILTDIFWYLAQIVVFEVLYTHTQKIGDWDLAQTKVFLGIIFVVDAFYMILLHDNLDRFSDRVRKGELDLILAKPISSQFFVSLQRVSTALIGNLMIGLTWLTYSLMQLPDLEIGRLAWLLLLIPCGLMVLYSLRFSFAAVAVVITRAENLQFLWYQLYKLGMRPDSIYAPWLKVILLSFFPMILIASVPARSILEPANPLLFGWSLFVGLFSLWLSTKFWHLCLRFYSSASS